jgi:hypothetical protein
VCAHNGNQELSQGQLVRQLVACTQEPSGAIRSHQKSRSSEWQHEWQSFEEAKRRLRERCLRHYLYPRWPPEPISEGHRKSTVTSDVTNGGPPASEEAVLGAELARLALRMELAMCPMAWLYALLPQQSNGSRRSPV